MLERIRTMQVTTTSWEIRLNLDFRLIFNLLNNLRKGEKKSNKKSKYYQISYLKATEVSTKFIFTSSGSELRDVSLKARLPTVQQHLPGSVLVGR